MKQGRTSQTNTAVPVKQQYLRGGYAVPHPIAELDVEIERRTAAQEHFIPFCQYTWHGFKARPHRQLIGAALEMVERGEIDRLILNTPPQVGKSTEVSQFFPPWYLGRHPNDNIILASYNADLAANHSFMAREIMLSSEYRNVFGDFSMYDVPVALSDKAAATKHWRLRQPYRGGLKSAGVGGGIGGYTANLLIIDDPVKDAEEADSEKIRASHMDWYKQVAYARLSHGEDGEGAVILCTTRWHDLDMAGQLLKEQAEGGEKWHVLRLTAVGEDPLTIAEWAERSNVEPEYFLVADDFGGLRSAA